MVGYVKILKRKFKNLLVYKKMLIMYSFLLVALLVISMIAVEIILTVYDHKLYQMSAKELGYYIQTMDKELKDIEQISYDIAMDYDLQKMLRETMLIEDSGDYSYNMFQIRNRLMREAVNADSVEAIVYTDRRGIEYQEGERYIQMPEERYQVLLKKCEEAAGGYSYLEPSPNFPYYLSGRDIRYYIDASLEYLGTVVLVSNISELIEKSRTVMEINDASLYIRSGSVFIYGADGELSQWLLEHTVEQEYDVAKIEGKRYFICCEKSRQYGWTYYNIIPYNSIFMLSMMARYILIFAVMILFLCAVLIIKKVARYITYPLEALTNAMGIVEQGDFKKARDYLGESQSEDEIGLLWRDFDTMLEKIEVLIKENYEKQILLKDTMYQSLRAQINPHFLYNTLNSVNWMIRDDRKEEAVKMVVSLGELLHQAFSKDHSSTVQDEVKLLENYIYIQKLRYEDRGQFLLEYKEDTKDMKIPRMILQPIVENAIYYGIDQSLKMCMISITIWAEAETLKIKVSDDGPGMDQETLIKVQTFTMKPKRHGIGLKNIHDRLELLYKDRYTFEISSEPWKETTILLTIPVQIEKGEDTCIKW